MEKLPPKPKPSKSLTKDDLLYLDKNDLIDKIIQLQAHNAQLKNIISKSSQVSHGVEEKTNNKKFDFKKCHYRRVLLKIMYFGWNYQGLAVQEDSNQTIEHHLFHALTKSCLIENRETSQYHRCGRTDKGVSAFGQIISITLRSKHELSRQDLPESLNTEMPYCKILNRLLPKEIRAIAWMPIPKDKPDFSASNRNIHYLDYPGCQTVIDTLLLRYDVPVSFTPIMLSSLLDNLSKQYDTCLQKFDCKKRQYKYYFPRSSLDIGAMKQACALVIGSHDFRHLCKMDVGNGVTEFTREILRADILPVDKDSKDPTSMYVLIIEGNAFLWHQIRCIMGVLLLVGQGRESPNVISDLLDIHTNPCKPQYNMALDIPLNLFKCSYDVEDSWVYDPDELRNVISHVQNEWTIYNVKATMIKDSLKQLQEIYKNVHIKSETDNGNKNESERDSITVYTDCLTQGVKPKVYTPLLKRETCSSLEERIEYYSKKRKIGENVEKKKEAS